VFRARLSNQWLSAGMCIKAIKLFCDLSIDIAKMLDVLTFNQAISKSPDWGQLVEFYNVINITGVWQVTYDCESFYLSNQPGKQIQYPTNIGRVWAQGIHDREVNLLWCSRSVDEALLDESDVPSKMMNLNLEKERQAMLAAENHLSSLQLASQTYWDSSTARTLFGAQKEDVNMLVTSNWKIENCVIRKWTVIRLLL